jgi:hypothetical protein
MAVCPGKSPLAISPFKKKNQKTEHQTELNLAMYWIPNLWKAYLLPARLSPIPVSICLEKKAFLPTSWFQSCLHKSANPTDEH